MPAHEHLNYQEFGLFAQVEEDAGIFWDEPDVRQDFARSHAHPDKESKRGSVPREFLPVDPEFTGLAPERIGSPHTEGEALSLYLSDYGHRSGSN